VVCLGLLCSQLAIDELQRCTMHLIVVEEMATPVSDLDESAPTVAIQESPDIGPGHETSLTDILDQGREGKLSDAEAERYAMEIAKLLQ
jgi:hypothetical protein